MGETVARTDDKGIERILRIQHMRLNFFPGYFKRRRDLPRHRFVSFGLLNDEADIHLLAHHLQYGCTNQLGVSALQPFHSKRCRCGNDDGVIGNGQCLGSFKPSVKTRFTQLGLYDR